MYGLRHGATRHVASFGSSLDAHLSRSYATQSATRFGTIPRSSISPATTWPRHHVNNVLPPKTCAYLPLAVAPISRVASLRHLSTSPQPRENYGAVVVGAGPAGITALGNLLERKVEPILWIDDAFSAGRVNARYREVPSNTKVKLFVDFATATAPFRDIVKSDGNTDTDKLGDLRSLDQQKGCHLSHAADMLLMLTAGLRSHPQVDARQAKVSDAVLDEKSKLWSVQIEDIGDEQEKRFSAHAQRLVLCTGSSPNNSPLPVHIPGIEVFGLDDALSPTILSEKLSPLGPTRIAVIGASHSAILVLRNLYNLASTSKPDLQIQWYTRHGLRYAQEMDGWILRDNTGLKGEAAQWAKDNLEPDVMDKSDVSRYVTKIAYESGAEKEVFAESMPGTDFYVQAIGYTRDPVPPLKTSEGSAITPQFDNTNGSFFVSNTKDSNAKTPTKLPGLYGAGIAWPERVTDPHGNVEYAVGFFKFMKFVKRVSPHWN